MISSEQELLDLVAAWSQLHARGFAALEALPGDVSPRRYLRARETSGETRIVAWYPDALLETGDRFCRTTRLLLDGGIRVPEIEVWDRAHGIMLLEDCGGQSVYDLAGKATVEGYWRDGLAILERIARLEPASVERLNPRIDCNLLRTELDQSLEMVLDPRGLAGSAGVRERFLEGLDTVCRRLDEAPPRPCHRDFMARNLLVGLDGGLTVIDHQDLRMGPPWYDLASLLNDSLYASERQEVELLELAGVPPSEHQSFHRSAAQRTLKIVGTFASFARRGFDRHLILVPASLEAARRHLEALPETSSSMRELASAWDRPEALSPHME